MLLPKLLGYLSKVAPKNFQKLPKSCSFHEKVAQKLLLSTKKKSVSTTDESKSFHIYTSYLLMYIFLPARLHSYTYRDDILVPPPVYLILRISLWESVLNIGNSPLTKIMLFNIQ